MREQKILVAYFSHKGENYSNGSIVNLDKGNTEIAAEMIAAHKQSCLKLNQRQDILLRIEHV